MGACWQANATSATVWLLRAARPQACGKEEGGAGSTGLAPPPLAPGRRPSTWDSVGSLLVLALSLLAVQMICRSPRDGVKKKCQWSGPGLAWWSSSSAQLRPGRPLAQPLLLRRWYTSYPPTSPMTRLGGSPPPERPSLFSSSVLGVGPAVLVACSFGHCSPVRTGPFGDFYSTRQEEAVPLQPPLKQPRQFHTTPRADGGLRGPSHPPRRVRRRRPSPLANTLLSPRLAAAATAEAVAPGAMAVTLPPT